MSMTRAVATSIQAVSPVSNLVSANKKSGEFKRISSRGEGGEVLVKVRQRVQSVCQTQGRIAMALRYWHEKGNVNAIQGFQ